MHGAKVKNTLLYLFYNFNNS